MKTIETATIVGSLLMSKKVFCYKPEDHWSWKDESVDNHSLEEKQLYDQTSLWLEQNKEYDVTFKSDQLEFTIQFRAYEGAEKYKVSLMIEFTAEQEENAKAFVKGMSRDDYQIFGTDFLVLGTYSPKHCPILDRLYRAYPEFLQVPVYNCIKDLLHQIPKITPSPVSSPTSSGENLAKLSVFNACNFSPVPKAQNSMEPDEFKFGFNG